MAVLQTEPIDSLIAAKERRLLNNQQELLISADSHVDEPPDLWAKEMPKSLRDQVPPLQDRSKDLAGATNPADRPIMMLEDTVSAEILFPSIANKMYAYEDPALQEACFRVYNDWIADYRSVAPGRLVALPCISTYNIDNAVAELKRCTALGTKGALVWHVPPKGLEWKSGHYDPLWAAAEEMDEPIAIHIASGFSYNIEEETKYDATGIEYFRGLVNHRLRDVINVLFDFIYYGVFERFPKLKLLLAEFQVGWIPWLLNEWDSWVRFEANIRPLPNSLLPSEYFERNVFVTFIVDHIATDFFRKGWGVNKCMWSSDFPHLITPWPNSREFVDREFAGLDARSRARLLSENVAELFRLDLPSSITQANIG